MSGKINLKELYEIMNVMASKHALDAALQKMSEDGETDSITETLARLSELNVEQLVPSGEEGEFKACIDKVYELIFDGIENQTHRWNEDDCWDVEAFKKIGKSLENCFRESNTTYAKSSWYGKTKLIKPYQKVSEMQMLDEEMIMQCCIGLHRTENEAANLMLWANYHPFVGKTQATTEQRRCMYQVLQRPQYCAKQWNGMFFGGAQSSDVTDYTRKICNLVSDALKREGWAQTEQEKEAFCRLEKKHDHMSVLYKLLLAVMEKRLEGVNHLQCLNRKQIDELLKSLEKKEAFHDITQQDKQMYERIAQELEFLEGAKKWNRIRLQQILYLSAALRFSKKDAAWMLQRLGYIKSLDSFVGSEGDSQMDKKFMSELLKKNEKKKHGNSANPSEKAPGKADKELLNEDKTKGRSSFVHPSEKAQREVYGKLFRRLMDYRSWTKPEVQEKIKKLMDQNDRDYVSALIDLLCSTRLDGVDAQAVKSGRWIPDNESMKRLNDVLSGDDMTHVRSSLDQIRELYAKRVEKLLVVCRKLGMTPSDTLGLLEAAGMKPTLVMRQMALAQNEKKAVDENFCNAMLRAFSANVKTCMPCIEPDDMAVTAVFNRLIPAAKEQGGSNLLTDALKCYFSQMEYKETEKKVCRELDRLGVISADRTLMEIVKLTI